MLFSCFSWLKSLWRKKCCNSKVAASGEIGFNVEDYLESERCKEELGDFTLSEYNEKGIQHIKTSCAIAREFAVDHVAFAIVAATKKYTK